jgi:hypothetical protein
MIENGEQKKKQRKCDVEIEREGICREIKLRSDMIRKRQKGTSCS